MAVAIVRNLDQIVTASQTNTFAFDCTGCNVLVVFAWNLKPRSFTGCTYAGSAMTELYDLAEPGGAGRGAAYILVNPASGSNNVVITCDVGTTDALWGGAIGLSGVDTTTPNRTIYTDNTGSGSITIVDSQNGDLCLDSLGCRASGATIAPGAGQTQIDIGSHDVYDAADSYEAATGANTVMSWSNITDRAIQGGFAIVPAAAGGGLSIPVAMATYNRMRRK